MKKLVSLMVILAALVLTWIPAAAQDMVVLDSLIFNCSTSAQEGVLWLEKGQNYLSEFPYSAGGGGWSLWHEFGSSASGTLELKYTEQLGDIDDDGDENEYDDNDWNTLEAARAYDTTTNIWFHHALTLDACMGVRVYVDHSDATGTHTVYLIGHERK